jgi:hypothetical protein
MKAANRAWGVSPVSGTRRTHSSQFFSLCVTLEGLSAIGADGNSSSRRQYEYQRANVDSALSVHSV